MSYPQWHSPNPPQGHPGHPAPAPFGHPQPVAYGPPPPVRRTLWSRLKWRLIPLLVVVIVLGGASVLTSTLSIPERGDCLADVEKDLLGWNTVPCDDPDAAWKVVAAGDGSGPDTCREWPTGRQVRARVGIGTDKSTKEFCAVPIADAG